MKILISIISLFLFSIVLGTDTYKNADEKIIYQISQKLEEAANREDFSGTFLLAKNGNILFEKAYGMANRQYQSSNNIETKFNLASEGKLFTSVAIAQLIEKGKLSLSDSISKYLTDWLDDPSAKSISIQDLLVHTSGLGSFFDNSEFRLKGSSGLYLQVEDYKPLIKSDKLRFKPGTNQLYSNNGYILLGAIIEKVSGQNYFEYIQKNIFDPAKMENSGFYEMDDSVSNLAIGFGKQQEGKQNIWKNNLFTNVFKGSPAGGGFSTVHDMLKFVNALQNHVLLSKSMVDRFFSGIAVKPDAKFYIREINVQGQKFDVVFSDYGPAGVWNEFGLEIYSTTPLKLGHNGGGMRGIENDCVIWPQKGYVVLYFSNYTGEGIYHPGPEIKQLIDKL